MLSLNSPTKKSSWLTSPLGVEPVSSFIGWHLLDGIAQSRAGHLMDMLLQELPQQVHTATLTHLAQHPAHSLVQVIRPARLT